MQSEDVDDDFKVIIIPLKDSDINNKCSECSRRKWYQKGYEDGKKDMCKDDWIPVEDGLPEEGEEVEVTIEEMADSAGGMRYYTKTAWVQEERWVIKRNPCNPRVIAWRPLPEPYKPKKLQTEEKPVQ